MTPNGTPNPTWYDILGVGNDASPAEIKAAWRSATDKFEPGTGATQFRLFNEAADVLLNPERRAAYDAELAGETPDAEAGTEVPHVETPDDEPAGSAAATVEPEPVEIAEPEDTTGPEQARPPPGPGGFVTRLLGNLGKIGTLGVALVAVLTVASLVLAAFLAVRVHHRVQDFDAGPDAAATADRALTAVLSYDYRHMDADRDRSVKFLTPKYEKEYVKTFKLLTEGPNGTAGGAVKTKAVVTADVLGTGVVDAERDRVRVIAFVNQSSVKGSAAPAIFQNRVVVTMVHRGDDWLIDNIKSY